MYFTSKVLRDWERANRKVVWEDDELVVFKYPPEWAIEGLGRFNMHDKLSGEIVIANAVSLKEAIRDLPYAYSSLVGVRTTKEGYKPLGVTSLHKVFRGKGTKEELVLDVGAGSLPDTRATHAVDIRKPEKSWVDIEYISGRNLEKEDLPYESSKFDRLISYGGLGWNFGNKKAFREAKRVLKVGGLIELGVSTANTEYTIKSLRDSGFERIEKKDKKGLTTVTASKLR